MQLFKQSTSMCGPTSLRILLSHYTDKKYSEKELQKLSGATKRDGVNHQGLRNALIKLGYLPNEKRGNGVWKALKCHAPAICGIWSPGDSKKESCGHYVVVSKVNGIEVEIYDPEFNNVRILTKKELDNLWFDEESDKDGRQWMLFIAKGEKHGSGY